MFRISMTLAKLSSSELVFIFRASMKLFLNYLVIVVRFQLKISKLKRVEYFHIISN